MLNRQDEWAEPCQATKLLRFVYLLSEKIRKGKVLIVIFTNFDQLTKKVHVLVLAL